MIYTPEQDYLSGWKYASKSVESSLDPVKPVNSDGLGYYWNRGFNDGAKAVAKAKETALHLN